MTVLAHRLQAVLRVHPGEGRTLAWAVAVAFLADAAIMIAQSSIDALFLARYGVENLPTLYLIVGGAMFLTAAGVGALLARVGRERVFVIIPAAISVAALVGRAALEAEATWVYGALWILQSVAEFTCLLAIWGVAGLVSDTRQAKRFFPLIAAGGVVGLIVGGLVTGPLAAALGSENLLLVWAALMGAATAMAWRLVSKRPPAAEAPRARRRPSALLAAVRDVRAPGRVPLRADRLEERRRRQHVGGSRQHDPCPPPRPRPRVTHGRSDAARNHGRWRGRPDRTAIRRTPRALRSGPGRLRTCSRLDRPHPKCLPACPPRGSARRTSHDLRHTGGSAGSHPECRRRRARHTQGPPHRPRGRRASARGECPRRPRPSRSGRGPGFCGRGRRRGRGSASCP